MLASHKPNEVTVPIFNGAGANVPRFIVAMNHGHDFQLPPSKWLLDVGVQFSIDLLFYFLKGI